MNKDKIENIGNDIASNVRGKADEASNVAENIASTSRTFLETQLDTFTELTNIAIEGTEKMVELNVAAAKESVDGSVVAVKELLATKGNVNIGEMEDAASEAVDATEKNVAKAKEIVKKETTN